ncbi:glucosamine 6-phosphate synthetase [PVC group bacterium]|nr:glucosamine 6-phosphate synthetase [PVC group bacterium]
MCGLFGLISGFPVNKKHVNVLVEHTQQRGRDSSGLMVLEEDGYRVYRADFPLTRLAKEVKPYSSSMVVGHSRLITDGLSDNQPVVKDGICVLHNGIVVNHETIWDKLTEKRELQIDTEVIAAIASTHIKSDEDLESLPNKILSLCQGIVACALVIPKLGKLCLFSNNGSLYIGNNNHSVVFSSEEFPLNKMGCKDVRQVREALFIDIPTSNQAIKISDNADKRVEDLVPALPLSSSEEKLLEYKIHNIRRCTKCVLPETMPYISFDVEGVCNYCQNYKLRNKPRPVEELFELVKPYRRSSGNDCIVPFSGGRDSCYGLHLVVKELKMKPVTYTYDWGMITDLGRRNISRMCATLGVENIIVADDISKKRKYIRQNLRAWLKSPHLGMISILTAGDKHFFRHVETIKRQTGISLNLWGVNPLEVTHFKSGFLGVPPDFEEKRVYTHGVLKQLRYQCLRLKAMRHSFGYFNRSLWDTLSGEYYRSFTKKSDYYHIFDYWRWDEKKIEETLDGYDWERAPDTNTTWRIGDGTAAFYNYIYYSVAGFTEHDTFRSNQIREGEIARSDALALVEDENRPRYPNVKWYLDSVGINFNEAISVINSIPKLYSDK